MEPLSPENKGIEQGTTPGSVNRIGGVGIIMIMVVTKIGTIGLGSRVKVISWVENE